MGQPFAFGQFHVRKDCLEGRILRGTGIDAKADPAAALPHMADTQLRKMRTVRGTFDAVIILPAAETVPHRLDGRVDGGGCPVGITVVGHHTAQMLKVLVFVFDGALQPVVTVQIHDDAALIKAVVAFLKGSLHHEAEVFFLRFHLEHRGIVIAEMVVGPLPQIGMGPGDNFNPVIRYGKSGWFPGSLKILNG